MALNSSHSPWPSPPSPTAEGVPASRTRSGRARRWEALATLTLTGPGGPATLDGDTDRPTVIVRDPRTGQIRAIMREWPAATAAGGDAAARSAGPGLDVLFSSGLPLAEAWRR